jgi:hypothetical protein
MRGRGVSHDDMIEYGNLTLELLPTPSWLIRSRNSILSKTAPYGWVATLVQISPGVCEIKGYVALVDMTLSERRELKNIVRDFGFHKWTYERYDGDGNLRAVRTCAIHTIYNR